jgi:hypothetical protein
MDREQRQALIAQYEQGYAMIMDALDGITEAEWDAREAPGEWSPREIAHHLADSEMASALRIRMLLAQDHPQVVGYDQEQYARVLYYDRPVEPSLAAFKAARESTAPILCRMTDAQWQRAGTHSESGPYTAEDWLRIYAHHAYEHADQIRRARAAAR